MSKLREFLEWPVEQVMETARMLYGLSPFPPNDKSEQKWNPLVQQAFDFLDNLHEACETIAKRRREQDAAYRRAERRSADAEALPDVVPFEKAMRFITREKRTKRAESKFEKFVLAMPRYFGGGTKPARPQTIRAQIARWRKNGVTRGEVMQLQSLHDIARQQRIKLSEKKRKPWSDERRARDRIRALR
jgi:hypothetical protein